MSEFGNGTAAQAVYEAIEGAIRYDNDGNKSDLTVLEAIQVLMQVVERVIQSCPYWFKQD